MAESLAQRKSPEMADNIVITLINTQSCNGLRTPYGRIHSFMHAASIYSTPTKCQAVLLGRLDTAVSKDRCRPCPHQAYPIVGETKKQTNKQKNPSIFPFCLLIWSLMRNGKKWSRRQSHCLPRPEVMGKLQLPPFSLPIWTPKKPRTPPYHHLCPTTAGLRLHSTHSINNLPNKLTKRLISMICHEFLSTCKKKRRDSIFFLLQKRWIGNSGGKT